MVLDESEIAEAVGDLWLRHYDEIPAHDVVYRYVVGDAGVPDTPEGSNDELADIARMSVKNVCSLVRDAFAQNLSVVGFRPPAEAENAAEVWRLWQQQRLDARQAEVHRAAITYGVAYAVVDRGQVRTRSPRQLFAAYVDPHYDEWPAYSLETWLDTSGRQVVRRGVLMAGEWAYPVDLGVVYRGRGRNMASLQRSHRVTMSETEEPYLHGSAQPPVVRFVNHRDTEDLVVGEVEPLIKQQKAINAVNFDRLVVSRFGAFPQQYVIGWAPSGPDELVRSSVARLMAFEDPDVKAGAFPAASVEQYNSMLSDMLAHVAMTAQIPPMLITGTVANISAETLAQVEKPFQMKLAEKRESFGESWEQVLRTLAANNGVGVDDTAEVVWRDTEARTFAQVVDGIVKLHDAGIPVETMLEDIPGWGQQRVQQARKAIEVIYPRVANPTS